MQPIDTFCRHTSRELRRRLAVARVLSVVSLGALVWSIYTTFAIGFHASDTHSDGDVDNWIWLVMAGSLIVLVVSSVVIGHLRVTRQRDSVQG